MIFYHKYNKTSKLFDRRTSVLFQLIFAYVFSAMMFSCQSNKTVIDIKNLDSRLLSSFSVCSSGGGTNDTQVYKKEKLYGSFDVEWLARSGSWKTVVMSSIGQDLMSVDYNKKQNKILISEAVSFPYDIKVGKGGFVYVEGKMTPIKVSEIPCFLNHRYPSSWLKSAVVYKKDNSYLIDKKESQRHIELEMLVKSNSSSKNPSSKEQKKEDKIYACATLSWEVFLWFDTSIKICMEDNKSSMLDIKKYMIKLTAIE